MGEKTVGSGLYQRLEREVQFWRGLGLRAELERFQRGNRLFYRCSAPAGRERALAHLDAEEIVRASLAVAICETIFEDIEPVLLERCIAHLRPGYRFEETVKVASAARVIAHGLQADPYAERNRVLERIIDYLSEADVLMLDGFVRFRLKGYVDELMDCSRQAVDDFEVEKEREELVSLLKDFVATRPASVETVHVVLGKDRSLCLLDATGAPLETESLDDWRGVLGGGGHVDEPQADIDELLISALVTIAPGRVVCHRPIRIGDIPMVVDVFTGRLDTCSGCELCQGRAAPDARHRLH